MPSNLGPTGRGRANNKQVRLGAGPQGSKYQAQSIIGRGAFGTAFLVINESGEQCVLKRVEIAHVSALVQTTMLSLQLCVPARASRARIRRPDGRPAAG